MTMNVQDLPSLPQEADDMRTDMPTQHAAGIQLVGQLIRNVENNSIMNRITV